MTVRGRCRSNDDRLKKFEWPVSFAAVPRRGDRVMSIDGKATAAVASITHSTCADLRPTGSAREPYIIIELTRG